MLHNLGMNKEELERRCAEMRAKYAGAGRRSGEVERVDRPHPSLHALRQAKALPPLSPPAASDYEIENAHPLIRATMKAFAAFVLAGGRRNPFSSRQAKVVWT